MNDPLSTEIRRLTKYERLALWWGGVRGLIKNILLSAMTAAVTSEEMAKQFKLVEKDDFLSPYFIAALTIGASYEILMLFTAKNIEESELLDEKRKRISYTKIVAVARNKPGEAFLAFWTGSVQKRTLISEEESEENIRISCCMQIDLIVGAMLGIIRGCVLAAAPTAIATREFFTAAAPRPLQDHLISTVYFLALIYGASDEIEKIIAGKRITAKDINIRKNLISRVLSVSALASRHPRSALQLACCCHRSIPPVEALELEIGDEKRGINQKPDDDHSSSENSEARLQSFGGEGQNTHVSSASYKIDQTIGGSEGNYRSEKDTNNADSIPIADNIFIFFARPVEKNRYIILKSAVSNAQLLSKISNKNDNMSTLGDISEDQTKNPPLFQAISV